MQTAEIQTDGKEAGSILIVDDNPDNLRLLSKLLRKYHYKVRVASNGARALATIQKEAPDLILLDIMMPGLDGYEVCRELKFMEATAAIPVIFISALNETIDKVKAFTLGGVDYIAKPFQDQEVLARIKTHLSLSALQRRLAERNAELQKALDEIKTLRGIIPICSSCKKIRNSDGCWEQIESYIRDHSDAQFSHGTCEACARKLYPEFYKS